MGPAAGRAVADGPAAVSGPSGTAGASGASGVDAPSDDQSQTYDPADRNRDGTVTPRERRQYNRLQRGGRAGGARASGASGASGAAPDEGASEAAAQRRSDAAGKSASAAADAMKNSLTPDGAGDLKLGGAGQSGNAAGAGAKSSGNPGDPRTQADFALAARSGYAPAFAAAGLKLGTDGRTIVRTDGSPATASDYARLRQGILAMPAALSRRPDFFAAVSPAHYTELKEGYRENPGLAGSVYKHVGTTDADRDFVHTASCVKLSGDCNESVEKPSYKKGDFVAPEDLDRMWGALQKELDSAEDPKDSPDRASGRSESARGAAAPRGPDLAGSFDGGSSHDARASSGADGASGAPAPAPAAFVAARRLWKSATAAIGLGENEKDAAPARGLGYGAAALAALAAAGFALRGRS